MLQSQYNWLIYLTYCQSFSVFKHRPRMDNTMVVMEFSAFFLFKLAKLNFKYTQNLQTLHCQSVQSYTFNLHLKSLVCIQLCLLSNVCKDIFYKACSPLIAIHSYVPLLLYVSDCNCMYEQ